MKTDIRHITCIALILFSCFVTAKAQSGFFIPAGGTIFFNGDSSTVFSDILNLGKFGIGKKATLNFYGSKWENDNQSMITDESDGGAGATGIGGVVRFMANDTVPQLLDGGYNAVTGIGPAFYHLKIENQAGIELNGSNAKVRNELEFIKGMVYVKDYILSVGSGNPGEITGYDSLHYVVTDGGVLGGFLLREGISFTDGSVVFPIGTSRDSYTPVGIFSKTNVPDNFYASVVDGIKREPLTVELTRAGVKKTWLVGKQLRPGEDNVEINLQHLNLDEGSYFKAHKQHAYVSQYVDGVWDIGSPQSQPLAGTLTTGGVLSNSGMNNRIFSGSISTGSYFTKLTGKGDYSDKKTIFWFNGYRLDANYARIYWRTNPEFNNKYFVVERRLSNETEFKVVDTLLTKSEDGISIRNLNYEIKDPNNYTGVSFYRLRLVDRGYRITYSNIIAVAPMPGKYKLLLWPNPTPNRFYIGLNGEVQVRLINIWNAVGKLVRQENVNGRSIMEVSGLIPGTYFVSFVSTIGQIIETKKVVVLGY